MELADNIKMLPLELQQMIYWRCFEGSANRIFKQYIEENKLFKHNVYVQTFKPNADYTLFQFLCDMKLIKNYGKGWWLDSENYDIEEFLAFIIDNHVIDEDITDSENESESDEEIY
jgi:hypothetical protein